MGIKVESSQGGQRRVVRQRWSHDQGAGSRVGPCIIAAIFTTVTSCPSKNCTSPTLYNQAFKFCAALLICDATGDFYYFLLFVMGSAATQSPHLTDSDSARQRANHNISKLYLLWGRSGPVQLALNTHLPMCPYRRRDKSVRPQRGNSAQRLIMSSRAGL